MCKTLLPALLLVFATATAQNKGQTRTLAIEPRTGITYGTIFGGNLHGHIGVTFTRMHALVFGVSASYGKETDKTYQPSKWGTDKLTCIRTAYINLPLFYRLSFGKKKSRGFFESGVGFGIIHSRFWKQSSGTEWRQGVPYGVQYPGHESRFTGFDFSFINALGYRYSISPSLDFMVAAFLNVHTGNLSDGFYPSGAGQSAILLGGSFGFSYVFKTYEHKWLVNRKKRAVPVQ